MFERIHSGADQVRLHLRGSLDGDASSAMRDSLASLVEIDAREVVLDLSHVTFIDGSGIGAIAFLFKRLAARGRWLSLAGAAGQPLAMLRHLGLATTLGIDKGRPRRSFLSLPGLAWAR